VHGKPLGLFFSKEMWRRIFDGDQRANTQKGRCGFATGGIYLAKPHKENIQGAVPAIRARVAVATPRT